jgi:hypothetical protein
MAKNIIYLYFLPMAEIGDVNVLLAAARAVFFNRRRRATGA